MNNAALLARMHHAGLGSIELGLERVERFLARLGNPHWLLPPVIHVAGTNGKGSLIAYLSAIFAAAGYTAHRYISPHLVRFNERIVLDGREIGDEALNALLEEVVRHVEVEPVTFFESTTAAAFLAFSRYKADVLLLETGMGGRLDATNVVAKPALAAITPISLDHRAFLGHSIAEIAAEKAGIMKRGVPCVVGRQGGEAMRVLNERAEELGAPLYRMDREWQVDGAEYRSPERTLTLRPALAGRHQYDNAATAVACIDRLPEFSIGNAAIAVGLARVVWPGRLQRLKGDMLPRGMELWLDGGHNPQGGEVLAQWLSGQRKEAYLVCGMIQGKDSAAYLKPLAPYVKRLFAVAIEGEAQSQAAESIRRAAVEVGMAAVVAESVEKALQTIAAHARTPAIICICGSLYLAGKVLAHEGE